MAEYIIKFDEFLVRCDENESETVSCLDFAQDLGKIFGVSSLYEISLL